jgi:hypothetical protein
MATEISCNAAKVRITLCTQLPHEETKPKRNYSIPRMGIAAK